MNSEVGKRQSAWSMAHSLRAEDRGKTTEVRGQMTGGRRQNIEFGSVNAEVGKRQSAWSIA